MLSTFSRIAAHVLCVGALIAAPAISRADDVPQFIRFSKGKVEGTGALQIAQTTYASEKTGVKVVLYGVVHIADASYYKAVQADLDSYDAVLYEGVKPPEGVKPEDSEMSGLGDIQKTMGELMGLTFQKDGINYHAKNLVHADMSFDQMQKASGGDMSKVMPGAGMFGPQMMKMIGGLMKSLGPMVVNYMNSNPAAQNSLKLQAAQQMIGQLDTMMSGEFHRVIVVERNKVALEVLDKELANRKEGTLAIFYGAAHNKDFHERLVARGFAKVDQSWKNAWTIGAFEGGDPAAKPTPPAPAPDAPSGLTPGKRYY